MFEYILLGIIQGITEFLPISSSGHLIIFKDFLDIPQSLVVDTTLHFATLLAVVFYYRKRIFRVLKSYYEKFSGDSKDKNKDFLLGNYILAASVPTFIAGVFFLDFFESLRNIEVVTAMLFLVAVYMLVSDYLQIENWKLKVDRKVSSKISLWIAFIIGLSQVIALIPGTSRSGITIATAVLFGVQKEEAAEFSFLLSLPAVAGAFVLSIMDITDLSMLLNINVFVSFTAALIAGYLSIHLLIGILKKYNFTPFVIYRIILVLFLLNFFIV